MTRMDEYRKYYGCSSWSDEKIKRLIVEGKIKLYRAAGRLVLRDVIDVDEAGTEG